MNEFKKFEETEVTLKAFHQSHRRKMREAQTCLRELQNDLAAKKRSRIDENVVTSARAETSSAHSPQISRTLSPK